MLALARLIRCAMVASGTRNAAAISAVVRPPTARRVSASCDGADSAGWQHRNSRVSVSSGVRTGLAARTSSAAAGSSRRRPGALAAPVVDQPARRDGDAARPAGCPAPRRPATAAPPPAAPPGPRPRRRRTGRAGAPARRGPAAPARAAGPRSAGRGSHLRRGVGHLTHLDAAGVLHDPAADLDGPGLARPRRAPSSRRCDSFDSAYGPSVVTTVPSSARLTVLAWLPSTSPRRRPARRTRSARRSASS